MYAASLDRLPLLLGAAPTVSFTVMIVGNLVVTSRRGVPRGRWIRHPDEEALLLERFVRGETERVRADVVQPAYDRHAVRLHLEAGVMIKAVPTQLSRLLGNLLDNAQRHARSAVGIGVHGHGDSAELTVSDDGAGIAEADRERIFQRFTRLDAGRGRDQGGTGLGLALAREIAHAHDGTLHVEDAPGGGARFVLRLPSLTEPVRVDPPGASGRTGS